MKNGKLRAAEDGSAPARDGAIGGLDGSDERKRERGPASALGKVRGFAFDLDGTIWAGPMLLPGAGEFVAELRACKLRVVFASNSSRQGAANLARRLTEMGIQADEADVVTAFDLVGDEIRHRLGRVRVLPLGTSDLAELMVESGHETVAFDAWQRAQAVVVGNDPAFDFGRLRAAARAIAAGAAFFAVNMDARFPVGENEFDPGNGGPGRGGGRGVGEKADRRGQTQSASVPGHDCPAGLQTGRGGHGWRQSAFRYRGRESRRNADHLAASFCRAASSGGRSQGRKSDRAPSALAAPAGGRRLLPWSGQLNEPAVARASQDSRSGAPVA